MDMKEWYFMDLHVEPLKHAVSWKGRVLPRFTVIEFRLLSYLVEHTGNVLKRTDLLAQVWDKQIEAPTRTVDTHIKRLRKKLGPAAKYLQTVHKVGYVLEPY